MSTPCLIDLLVDEWNEQHPLQPIRKDNPFIKFSLDYLDKHRVVENFPVNANHGVVLSNYKRALVSPDVDVSGAMQPANDVSITRGRSQPGMEGVTEDASIRIT